MKRNVKKVVSILLTTALSASVFAATASAASINMRMPQEFVLGWNDSADYIKAVTTEKIGSVDVTKEWNITQELAKYSGMATSWIKNTADGASTTKLKNNFIYEFEFMATSMAGEGVSVSIEDPNQGINGGFEIKFNPKVVNSEAIGYYIKQNTDSGRSGWRVDITDNKAPFIAPDADSVWNNDTDKLLTFGEWYKIKIEADMSYDGQIYCTVTGNNGEVYTAIFNNPVNYTEDAATSTEGARYIIRWFNRGNPVNFNVRNEKFTYDQFFAPAPTISINGGITASTTCYNVAPVANTTPEVICAVYDADNRLVKFNSKTSTAPSMAGLQYPTTSIATVTTDAITGLSDGTYTVKAFVWNSMNGMNPYKDSVSKTITVSSGTISE